jgi:electron transport complex protein RnfD
MEVNNLDKFIVSPSPHQRDKISTQKIMMLVIIALVPSAISSIYYFGLRALFLIITCAFSCLFFEYLCRKLMKKNNTISDLSAVLTGVLLAFNLPATLPIWMAIIGCFIAIAVTKQLFGGLGQNFANPAIVARIALMLSFTTQMTTWAIPKYWTYGSNTPSFASGEVIINGSTILTGATPLVSNNASYMDLFLGNVGGCLGETSALALLIGGLFLIIMKIICPSTPLAFIGTTALLTFISGGDVLYQVLSGGLIIGAFFMATDYVTTPINTKGKIIFGIGCGLITFIIRKFGSYPEGVSFSILIMNILTPYIDMITKTKPLGAKKPVKEAKKNA